MRQVNDMNDGQAPEAGRLMDGEERYGPDARRMVDKHLRARGIDDPRVLREMRSVPRHRFVSKGLRNRAYEDTALPTLNQQTISQPYIVALMTQMLSVEPADRVLEIGTGSGYQTIILARLGRYVVSIERDEQLAQQGRETLDAFGIENVEVHAGDGTLGWPEQAPYDRIIVTAGAPEPPQPLIDQLAEGGRLVIPVGDRQTQTMAAIDRRGGELTREQGIACRFVPLVGEAGWAAS